VTEIAVLRNVVSPAPRAIWQAVFDGDAEAVPYQSPQWTDALCRSTHRRDRSRLNIRPNPRAVDAWRAAMSVGAHTVARMAHAIDLHGGFDAVGMAGL
jgi:hypothetical protein